MNVNVSTPPPLLRARREEGGQALVEFALVLPLFVTLLFGIIQFGIAFNHYLVLTDAVRAGARTAAVSRTAPDPRAAGEDAVRKAAVDLDDSDLVVTVEAPSGWTRGSEVRVSATYPYSLEVYGLEFSSGRLSSTTTERIE